MRENFSKGLFKKKADKYFVIYMLINPWLGPRYLPHLMGTEEKTTQKPRAYRKKYNGGPAMCQGLGEPADGFRWGGGGGITRNDRGPSLQKFDWRGGGAGGRGGWSHVHLLDIKGTGSGDEYLFLKACKFNSLKTLAIIYDCSEKATEFMFRLSFFVYMSSWSSEQFSTVQAAFGMPQQALWRGFGKAF